MSLCAHVGTSEGISPICYSRPADISGTPFFQISTFIIHLIALIMTAVMIANVRSKYTAVGRSEISVFFCLFFISTILDMLLVTNIISFASPAAPFITAAHVATVTTTFCSLLYNGFIGFEFVEDGTKQSLVILGASCVTTFSVSFIVALSTFLNVAGSSSSSPIGLWIVYFLFNGVAALVYFVTQVALVVKTLEDAWPLGGIVFGAIFFVLGQSFTFTSLQICQTFNRYLDGLFFSATCNLLAVMMIYKFWDSITKEDLEFSISSSSRMGSSPWEIAAEDDASVALSSDDFRLGGEMSAMSSRAGSPRMFPVSSTTASPLLTATAPGNRMSRMSVMQGDPMAGTANTAGMRNMVAKSSGTSSKSAMQRMSFYSGVGQ